MNRKVVASVGVIIGAIVVFVAVLGGTSGGSSGSVAPDATEVAVTGPEPTVQPTSRPAPVETPEPSTTPAATTTASPTPTPTPSPTPTPTASPPLIPTTVRLPLMKPKVAGATNVNYFGITGESPAALLDDLVRRSRAACKSTDTLACVVQQPRVRWTNRTLLATGACTIVAPHVSLTSTAHLPQWERPKRVQPALLAWWRKVVDHLAWHEAQHIRIQRSYDSKLIRLMVGRKCSSANRIYKSWTRSVRAAQDRFDAKDASWPYPEYTGPGGFYGS